MKIEIVSIADPTKAKHVALIRKKLRENNNYCPCVLVKNEDTLCPCKEALETRVCHCGLYNITED